MATRQQQRREEREERKEMEKTPNPNKAQKKAQDDKKVQMNKDGYLRLMGGRDTLHTIVTLAEEQGKDWISLAQLQEQITAFERMLKQVDLALINDKLDKS